VRRLATGGEILPRLKLTTRMAYDTRTTERKLESTRSAEEKTEGIRKTGEKTGADHLGVSTGALLEQKNCGRSTSKGPTGYPRVLVLLDGMGSEKRVWPGQLYVGGLLSWWEGDEGKRQAGIVRRDICRRGKVSLPVQVEAAIIGRGEETGGEGRGIDPVPVNLGGTDAACRQEGLSAKKSGQWTR